MVSAFSTITFIKVIVLITIIVFVLLLLGEKIADKYLVWDYTDVLYAKPFKTFKVTNYEQIRDILQNYPNRKVSIAGGKFSHGGHTFKEDAIYLDMIDMNKIIYFDCQKKLLTAQSGATWKQILDFLDPYDLSVKAMQSYANFSLGGSISVNAHGRGVEYSTVGSTLLSMKVMLADGRTIVIYPCDELFSGVLGGYGGLAIILEATISLTDNYLIKKVVEKIDASSTNIYDTLQDLKNKDNENVYSDIVLYNGLIYPERRNDLFNIYYIKCKSLKVPEVSGKERLQSFQEYYWLPMLAEQLLRRSKILKYCRAYLEPFFDTKSTIVSKDELQVTCTDVPQSSSWQGFFLSNKEPVGKNDENEDNLIWRNWELSYDTNKHRSLLRFPTTTALQEYFIPINKEAIDLFMKEFNRITQAYNVNLLNISLRYVRSSQVAGKPILDYAPSDRLAIVIYYNLLNNPYSLRNAALWTQEVLDVLTGPIVKGSYYLPYLPFARVDQFRKAYPGYSTYIAMKKKYDPTNRFTSQFLESYLVFD